MPVNPFTHVHTHVCNAADGWFRSNETKRQKRHKQRNRNGRARAQDMAQAMMEPLDLTRRVTRAGDLHVEKPQTNPKEYELAFGTQCITTTGVPCIILHKQVRLVH